MMSIFSPASSLITPRTRAPIGPMHAPFGLTPGTVDRTAILVRCPASRATATISTDPSTSSGTSRANSLRTRLGWVRESVIWVPRDAARHAHDVAAHPLAVHVPLARHLLGLRQHALGPAAEVRPRTTPRAFARASRCTTPGDDLALLGGELAVGALVLGVAQPLHDHLARGGGRDPPEALGGVVPLLTGLAVVAGLVRQHADDPGLAVDVDPRVRLVALGVLVGGEQRGLDGLEHGLERDVLVALDGAQRGDVDVHLGSSAASPVRLAARGASVAPRSWPRVEQGELLLRRRGELDLDGRVGDVGVAHLAQLARRPAASRPSSPAAPTRPAKRVAHAAGADGDQAQVRPPPVPRRGQRPVHARRGDLQRVRPADEVLVAVELVGRPRG